MERSLVAFPAGQVLRLRLFVPTLACLKCPGGHVTGCASVWIRLVVSPGLAGYMVPIFGSENGVKSLFYC